MYQITKKWGPFSCAFRQPNAIGYSHCQYVHGYGLTVEATFTSYTLDKRGWVIDYGGLKPIKAKIEEMIDHKTIVSRRDPDLDFFLEGEKRGIFQLTYMDNFSCEHVARFLHQYISQWLEFTYKSSQAHFSPCSSLKVDSVKVNEHWANSATYSHEEWM